MKGAPMGNGSFDEPMSPDEVGEDDLEEKEAIVPSSNTGADSQMSAGSINVTPPNQTIHAHPHGHPQWPMTSSSPPMRSTAAVTYLDGNNMPVSSMTSERLNGSVMTSGNDIPNDVPHIKMEMPNLTEIHHGHQGGLNSLHPHMASMGHQLGNGVNDWLTRKTSVPVHVLSQLHAINQQ